MTASAVGQVAAIAAGEQDKFDWKGVALSGLGAGVTAGIGSLAQGGGVLSSLSGTDATMVASRAMVSNALTQGISSIAYKDSKPFSWKNVAAAGAGAYAGASVSDAMRDTNFSWLDKFGNAVAKGSVSGFVGGMTTAVA